MIFIFNREVCCFIRWPPPYLTPLTKLAECFNCVHYRERREGFVLPQTHPQGSHGPLDPTLPAVASYRLYADLQGVRYFASPPKIYAPVVEIQDTSPAMD